MPFDKFHMLYGKAAELRLFQVATQSRRSWAPERGSSQPMLPASRCS